MNPPTPQPTPEEAARQRRVWHTLREIAAERPAAETDPWGVLSEAEERDLAAFAAEVEPQMKTPYEPGDTLPASVRPARESDPWWSRGWPRLAFGLALVTLLGAIGWQALSPPTLRDGPLRISSDGRIAGDLPAVVRERISALLDQARSGPSISRTGAQAPSASPSRALEPIFPADGVTVERMDVTLRWAAVPGAAEYELSVSGCLEPTRLKTLAFALPFPFGRGRIYSWNVRALDGSGALVTELAPPAIFKILPETSAAELSDLRRALGKSHLALATFYLRAGMRPEAMAELQALAAENPGSDLARKLVEAAARP